MAMTPGKRGGGFRPGSAADRRVKARAAKIRPAAKRKPTPYEIKLSIAAWKA